MIYIKSEQNEAEKNLAAEEYLFRCASGEYFLIWKDRPSLVCGAYQNAFFEADIPYISKHGIALIRRISGGGTVYHDCGNINYSLIGNIDSAHDYETLISPIVKALNKMSVPAELKNTCDIFIGDKKISGSAQKIHKGRFLHHGTLLFDSDMSVLRNSVRRFSNSDLVQAKGVRSRPAAVTNIKNWYSGSIDKFISELTNLISEDFSLCPSSLDTECSQISAATFDFMKIQDFEKKYYDWEWNFGRSPYFSLERAASIGGVKTGLRYELKNGRFTAFELAHTYFGAEHSKKIQSYIIGKPCEFEKLSSVIYKLLTPDHADALMKLIFR